MKKYMRLFIFVLFLFVPSVKALNGVCMIDSSYSNIKQNDEITISFYMHDIENLEINGGYLELQYDNNIFDFVRVESLYNGFNSDISNNDGILKLNLTSDSSISGINSNIVLARIRFKVKDNASNGDTSITMIGGNSSYIKDVNDNRNSCLMTGNKRLSFNVYNTNNEALLSSLNISVGNLNPSFNSNVSNYNVNVSNNISSINISGTCSVMGCNIDGNGSKNLNVGKNVFGVIVTSPNGKVTKTYTITITRNNGNVEVPRNKEIIKDSNNNLKSLKVSEGELEPIFLPEITEYSVDVDSSVNKIKIEAICSGIECTVKGTGNKFLKYGENSYEILVIAEDGAEKTYTVKVIRKYDLRLTSLIIDDYKLNQKFDKDVYTYQVNVGNNVDKLNIMSEAIHSNVMIQIMGNNNFTEGKNIIKIEVSYDDTDKKTYTIIVNKGKDDDVNVVNNKSIWDNTYVIIGGIIGGVILFGLIVGIIWYLLRKKNENN